MKIVQFLLDYIEYINGIIFNFEMFFNCVSGRKVGDICAELTIKK